MARSSLKVSRPLALSPYICRWAHHRRGSVGSLETLKQFKKDMQEVAKGLECGLNLAGFDDLRVGDTIQMFEEVEMPGKL